MGGARSRELVGLIRDLGAVELMMLPLEARATDTVLGWGDGLHRTVALHHAAIHGRPGLCGDHPTRPSSVIWLRDGGDQWEVFGAGFAGPALDWLGRVAVGRPVVLTAPASWTDGVHARMSRFGEIQVDFVQTWLRPEPVALPRTAAAVRPLNLDDAAAFAALAPPWAVRSWGSFAAALQRGAAFGVPARSGLASAAWVVESDHHADKVGVATDPRYRRLGLGRAVAAALLDEVEVARGRHALWVVNPGNLGSLGLKDALGFTTSVTESFLRWGP